MRPDTQAPLEIVLYVTLPEFHRRWPSPLAPGEGCGGLSASSTMRDQIGQSRPTNIELRFTLVAKICQWNCTVMNVKAPLLEDARGSSVSGNTKANDHLKYRPDIDGLRAFAILSVVLYHAFPSFMRGGFIGVDIFFVISGYLISSIIFKGLDSGTFSFLDFYQRRVKRIFPALILVLVSCYAVGWFTLMAGEFKMLGKHVAGGIGFIQNLVLYREAGYFDTSSVLKPLLHLWSLGVEEQFYILFPIAAWVMWRWRSAVLPVIVLLAVISLGADVHKLGTNPSAAFYMPQYRFWEILCGSIIAYITVFRPSTAHKIQGAAQVRNLISLAGAVLLIASVVVVDKYKAFPGFWALLPVSGSALMIMAGPNAWLNRKVMASRPMVWIGLISYPLYLWHWPVITYIRILGAEELSIISGVLAVVASTLLAYGTYKYVEVPFRNAKLRIPKTGLLLALGLTVAAVGAVTFVKNGLINRTGLSASLKDRESYAQYFENSLPAWAYFTNQGIIEGYRFGCDFFDIERYRAGGFTMEPRKQISPECYVPTTDTKVMLWGDSHAQQYYYGLSKTLPPSVSILQVASSGCEANLPGTATGGLRYCDRSNEFAFEVMAKEKPQVLVIAQLEQHDTKNNLTDLTARAKALGVKKVIVVGPVPRYDQFLNQLVVRKFWNNTPRRTKENLLPASFDTDRALASEYSGGAGGLNICQRWGRFAMQMVA